MSTTMLSIKLDKSLKQKAQELAGKLGVSLNAILNGYLKMFISERQVTFADHPMPNTRTQRILDELLADSRENKNIVGPFDSMKEMIKSLDS